MLSAVDLALLDDALSGLAALDGVELGEAATVCALERQLRRLEAVVDRAAAGLEARKDAEATGARSAAAWLAFSCRLPMHAARAQVARGRALRSLARTEAAFSAGEMGPEHVEAIAALQKLPGGPEALAAGEGFLVDQARTLSFAAFRRVCAHVAQLVDEDGAEARAEAMRAGRRVHLAKSFEGAVLGEVCLDPIAGAIVTGELERLEARLFETERREAQALAGSTEGPPPRLRTLAQRRADALVEMARRSAACSDDAPAQGALVSVLVDFPTLVGRICELSDGTVVSPGSVLPLLDEALVERAVWKSPMRIEVSAKARFFTGATRRAIELRDRVCQHPYCEAPAERCEVDHIVPASRGGPTTQENGRLACSFHNRIRNQGREWPEGGHDRPPPAAVAGSAHVVGSVVHVVSADEWRGSPSGAT